MAEGVKRLNYFDGQFLHATDFCDEQNYHIRMRRDHNRLLHTWGIADNGGLRPSAETGAMQVTISPGVAIDKDGREIVLANEQLTQDLKDFAGKKPFITIAYDEKPTDRSNEAGTPGDTRIELTPVIKLSETKPTDGYQIILGQVTVDANGRFQGVDTTTAVRTIAGNRAGDLSAVSLTLSGLSFASDLQPTLTVNTPRQIDIKGSLTISSKVGIGTSAPVTSLHVNPKIADDSARSYDPYALMVVHQTATGTATLNDPKDVLYLGRQGMGGQAFGAMATYKLSRYENNGFNARTRLDLALTHDGFTDSAVMTWLSSGRVGIGKSNPAEQLHVYRTDDTGWSGRGAFSGSTNAAIIGSFNGKAVVGAQSAALDAWKALYVNNDGEAGGDTIMGFGGKVGIGVAPDAKLDVKDRIRLREGSDTAGLWLYQKTPNKDCAFIGMKSDTEVGFWGTAGFGLWMDVATGNVGVLGRLSDKKLRIHVAAKNPVETAATGYVDMPDMSATFTAPIKATFQILVLINGVQASDQSTSFFQLLVDGGVVDMTMHDLFQPAWHPRGVFLSTLSSLEAGVHTVKVQWYGNNGKTQCCQHNETRQIQIIEL